ncbi:hypothetical protein [Rubrivirga sp.]|uniref:hypothetical protein n=1 Tax=Rubrivirga sp. TaxID=1885344 RepID=UPI003C76D3C8
MHRLLLVAAFLLASACSDGEVADRPSNPTEGEVDIVSNEDTTAIGVSDLEVDVDTTGPARIEVAGMSVPTRALATDMESGDRACYVMLREDGGAATTVMADYSVCDSDVIIGRRVQLDYEPGNVIAESCEGDPDCLDTETVAIAVTAVPIDSE